MDLEDLSIRLLQLCEGIVVAGVRSSDRKPEIALLSTFRIGDSTNAKKIPGNLHAPHDAILLRKTSDYVKRLYLTFRLGSILNVTRTSSGKIRRVRMYYRSNNYLGAGMSCFCHPPIARFSLSTALDPVPLRFFKVQQYLYWLLESPVATPLPLIQQHGRFKKALRGSIYGVDLIRGRCSGISKP